MYCGPAARRAPGLLGFRNGLRLQKAKAAGAGWVQLAGWNWLAALVYVDTGQATQS